MPRYAVLEPTTFDELLAHKDFVRNVARQLLADEHAAEDVVQQTWMAALRRPPRNPGAARFWLKKVVQSLVRQHRRSHLRRQPYEKHAAVGEDSVPSAAELTLQRSLRRDVVRAVLELREPIRSAIVLHYLRELTTQQVATAQDVPLETARSRIKKGRSLLREKLRRHCENLDTPLLPGLATLLAPQDRIAAAAASGGTVAGASSAYWIWSFLKPAAALALVFVASGFLVWEFWPRAPEPETPSPPAVLARAVAQPPDLPVERTRTAAPAEPAASRSTGPAAASASVPGVLRGVVRDPRGNAVAGATVHLVANESGVSGSLRSQNRVLVDRMEPQVPVRGSQQALTDAHGRYEIAPESAANYALSASHPEWGWTAEQKLSVVPDREVEPRELVFLDGTALTGRVLDEQGNGVPDARITVWPTDLSSQQHFGTAAWQTTSGAGGRFATAPLPVQSFELSVAAAGFAPAVVGPFASGDLAREEGFEVRLAREQRLRGSIVLPPSFTTARGFLEWNNRRDEPFRVWITPLDMRGSTEMSYQSGRAGWVREVAPGKFEYEVEAPLPAGEFVVLYSGRQVLGCARVEVADVAPALAGDPERFAFFERGHPILLLARDRQSGRFLSQFSVRLGRWNGHPDAPVSGYRNMFLPDVTDGVCRIPHLLEEKYVLQVFAEGHASTAALLDLEAEPGLSQVIVDLDARTFTFTTAFRLPGGELATHAVARLMNAGGAPATVPWPEERVFRPANTLHEFRGMAPGRYRVHVVPEQGAPAEQLFGAASCDVEVIEDGQHFEFALPPTFRVRLFPRNRAHRGPWQAFVRHLEAGLVRNDAFSGTSTDGPEILCELAPGPYRAKIYAPDLLESVVEFTVSGPMEVEFPTIPRP